MQRGGHRQTDRRRREVWTDVEGWWEGRGVVDGDMGEEQQSHHKMKDSIPS